MGGISARKTKNDAWSVYILCVVRARTWGRREVNGWIGLKEPFIPHHHPQNPHIPKLASPKSHHNPPIHPIRIRIRFHLHLSILTPTRRPTRHHSPIAVAVTAIVDVIVDVIVIAIIAVANTVGGAVPLGSAIPRRKLFLDLSALGTAFRPHCKDKESQSLAVEKGVQ